MEEIRLTHDGYQELVDELDELKTTGRKEIAEKIKVALSFGDLSENAEYDEAKTDQGKMEARINELETIIKNAVIIDENSLDSDIVNRATKIKVLDMERNEENYYKIVAFTQADPLNGLISDESPVGSALLGHRVDDVVEVETPMGRNYFKILEIEKRS